MRDGVQESLDAWAAEIGLPTVPVRRLAGSADRVDLELSALQYGNEEAQVVFVHGGKLQAGVWHSVALHLARPALAVDLPGHGRSPWYVDGRYPVTRSGSAVAAAIERHTRRPITLVGHSIGAIASIVAAGMLGAERIRRVVLVEGLPDGVRADMPRITARHSGTFDELVDSMHALVPNRSRESVAASVRRGATEDPTGIWSWHWDPALNDQAATQSAEEELLWDTLCSLPMPVALVVGERSPAIGERAIARLLQAHPGAGPTRVARAGHNVHSDSPRELAALITQLLDN